MNDLTQTMSDEEVAETSYHLDKNFDRIIDALRYGLKPETIAGLLGCPFWLVKRLESDLGGSNGVSHQESG